MAAGALTLALAAPAAASFQDVFSDYQSDGSISPCSHSLNELKSAQGQIPNDIQQYAPDFQGAVAGAIAGHSCGGKTAAGGATPGGADGSSASGAGPTVGGSAVAPGDGRVVLHAPPKPTVASAPAVTQGVAPIAAIPRSELNTPLPLIMLAVFAGLALLGLLLFGLGRAVGYDGRHLAPVRHGLGEMGLKSEHAISGLLARLRPGSR